MEYQQNYLLYAILINEVMELIPQYYICYFRLTQKLKGTRQLLDKVMALRRLWLKHINSGHSIFLTWNREILDIFLPINMQFHKLDHSLIFKSISLATVCSFSCNFKTLSAALVFGKFSLFSLSSTTPFAK